MSTRGRISQSLRSGRATVTASMSRFYPRTSLAQVQSPSSARGGLTLTEYLDSPGRDGMLD